MQLLDRPPANPTVTDTVAHSLSGQNQKIYARLKTSLRLNLRRQIFIAVCDDLELRNQVVSQLQAELIRPQFVSLKLNLADPNPMSQVVQWLAQYPAPLQVGQVRPGVGFQILGVEHLTRQPPGVQKRFLTHLQAIEYYLPMLDCALLLWLPRPWLRMVRQSAPTFWDWHTAVFEFEGDPTPLREVPEQAAVKRITGAHHCSAPAISERGARPGLADSRSVNGAKEQHTGLMSGAGRVAQLSAQQVHQPLPIKGWLDDRCDRSSGFPDDLFSLDDIATQQESLWDILTDDLARLDQRSPEAEPQGQRELARVNSSNATNSSLSTEYGPQSALDSPPLPVPSLQSSRRQPSSGLALELTELVMAAIAAEPTAEHHQHALQTLQQIEQLEQQQAPQQSLAAVYYTLGRLYREHIEQGDSAEQTLAIAIQAHHCALNCLEEQSSLWADALNDLGNLYWMHSRCIPEAEDQLTSLKHAIQSYQQALTAIDPQTQPHTFAMIQNNLGSAYGDLAQYQEPAYNLQQSVQAYEVALRYRTATDDPARHAATQNNLGTTCWNLAQHQQPIARLIQAIAAYQEALHYYTPERESISYAMIQNNLGTAYWNLAQHRQPSTSGKLKTVDQPGVQPADQLPSSDTLLHFAVSAYQNALVFRTLQSSPTGYAATQNNLGTAYWNLANGVGVAPHDRRDRLQKAITAYEAAIAAVETLTAQTGNPPTLTFDVFATRSNLGLAYYQLATDVHQPLAIDKRQTYLESSLGHHLSALQNWEPSSEFHQTALEYVLQTVRAFYTELGIQGQNTALSRIPPQFLPEIMQKI